MAKLLKLRRGTTTQHASFTGAEGEVTIDTTKDTAVVHDGSQAGGRPLAREDMSNVSSASIAGRLGTDSIATTKIAAGALPTDVTVVSANIVDGTIVNADINSGANIANSKLANSGVNAASYGSSSAIPIVTVNSKGIVTAASTTAIDSTTIANGTSSVAVGNSANITLTRGGVVIGVIDGAGLGITGNITTSGNFTMGQSLTMNSDVPHINFNDTGDNPDFQIGNINGGLRFQDTTNSASRMLINADGHIDIPGNVDFGAGVDVTGNMTVTGTVDGKDISALGITGTVLANGVTATTQGTSDNTTKVATTAYVTTAIGNIESFVTGMIILWSGAANSLPTGFVLCNGSNSTPDLRNKFVIGAGDTYAVNATGGSTTISNNVTHSHSTPNHSHAVNNHSHSTPNHSHTVSNHTHSISGSVSGNTNNTGSHSHSITTSGSNSSDGPSVPRRDAQGSLGSHGTNSAGNHNHSFSGSFSGNSGNSAPNTTSSGASNTGNSAPNTTSSGSSNSGNSGSGSTVSVLNPYYALCYIMKT